MRVRALHRIHWFDQVGLISLSLSLVIDLCYLFQSIISSLRSVEDEHNAGSHINQKTMVHCFIRSLTLGSLLH